MPLTPEQTFNELCEQATRLIATHIMKWEIRKVEFEPDGSFLEAYFKDDKQLGYIGAYEFNPATQIQDAFWVMDTLTKTRNARFEIDYDPKYECRVTTKCLLRNVTGSGAGLPVATVQAALYLIAESYPHDSTEQEAVYQLSHDLRKADEATVKYAEYLGDGLLIDLDKYMPR